MRVATGPRLIQCLLLIMLLPVANAARAQDQYPSRTVKIIAPVPPGPVADTLPRIIAEQLAKRWGVPVIVENRPGAANNLGAEAVAKAEPDGYTLLATPQGPLVISQSYYPALGFDPAAFVPITVFATQPLVLVANANLPFSTLEQFVEYAKNNPNKLNFGSPGPGSSLHLTGEMLSITAGIRMVHVPYKGIGGAMTDLLSGNIDVLFDNLGNTHPHIVAGKLKAIAVANRERVREVANVPAIAEMFPDFYSTSWFALVAPPKTPISIAEKISGDIARVLREPEIAERYRTLSISSVSTSPSETAAFLKREAARWRSVITTTGMTAN